MLHTAYHTPTWQIFLPDEAATATFAKQIAPCLKLVNIIYLEGNLGAGKTTFARSLLQSLGYQGRVKSPTYTIVEPYVISGLYFYHFDLYRFSDPIEWESGGFREYFHPQSVCLVEWPEKGQGFLPTPDCIITLIVQAQGRKLILQSNNQQLTQCLQKKLNNNEYSFSTPVH